MKFRLSLPILILLCLICALCGCAKKSSAGSPQKGEVLVYAYDSFVSEWGPGPQLIELFEKHSGYKVNLVSCGDAAQVFSRAVLEKKAPKADVLVGIDNQLLRKATATDIVTSYKSAASVVVPVELYMDSDWLLTPYDWGSFALIWDSESGVPVPRSLQDLTKPEYSKKIILLDPRTSTPGLGFLAWTVAVFGEKYADYWKALKPNILTMAPGWDTGYGLFTAGEAPLVVSYTTSPAYHVEYDKTERYKALIFAQGHVNQIEGVGLVKNAPNPDGGKAFIDFLLSEEAQSVLPLTQWMYPVNPAVVLPESYHAAPKAAVTLLPDYENVEKAVDEVIAILAK